MLRSSRAPRRPPGARAFEVRRDEDGLQVLAPGAGASLEAELRKAWHVEREGSTFHVRLLERRPFAGPSHRQP
jgi:hypothetical protein